jgi:Holliday junction resolvase RusA-like endonuclease
LADQANTPRALMIRFTILGEPASKGNQRQLVTFGRGADKRPALIKSKKALAYERDALKQIPPAHRVQLQGPVKVTLKIFYASERPDLDESVVLDVLQNRYKGKGEDRVLVQKGVYVNDRQVREKHVVHAIDRKNPRTEVEVEQLVPELFSVEPIPEKTMRDVRLPAVPF